jgi:hypothetical protein
LVLVIDVAVNRESSFQEAEEEYESKKAEDHVCSVIDYNPMGYPSLVDACLQSQSRVDCTIHKK